MDPVSMMLMYGVGLATQSAGQLTSMFGAHAANAAQRRDIGLERQVEGQRRQAMELDANRRRLETYRVAQRMRATALTTASSQGAQQGSGLAGAYGQIGGQSGVNLLGLNQNTQIGENIFGLNSQISDTKIAQANAQQTMQLGSGISSFGSSLMGASQAFGRLNSGFAGPNNSAPRPWGDVGYM